jgi:ribosomal protein S18 acetylase RimI-like enzyme
VSEKIRPLVEGDVDALAAALADLPLMLRYKRTAAALAADLRAGLARGDGLDLYDDDGPRGIAWYLPSGTLGLGGYLRLLAITGDTQRKGAGAALLVAFETGVATLSRHAFLLVSDFNAPAQRFYEKHGYTRVGALPGLVLPDVAELIYHKKLR